NGQSDHRQLPIPFPVSKGTKRVMLVDLTGQVEDIKHAKRSKPNMQASKPSESPSIPVRPIQTNQPTQVHPIQASTRTVRPRKKNGSDQNRTVDFFSLSERRREESTAVNGPLLPLGWCGKYARELSCVVCLGKPASSSARCLSYPDYSGDDFGNASRDAGGEFHVSESDPEEESNVEPGTESLDDAFGDSVPAEQAIIDNSSSEDFDNVTSLPVDDFEDYILDQESPHELLSAFEESGRKGSDRGDPVEDSGHEDSLDESEERIEGTDSDEIDSVTDHVDSACADPEEPILLDGGPPSGGQFEIFDFNVGFGFFVFKKVPLNH
ncbi:hypothetical protein BGX26_006178, partial [Mortierella sp. AD094]